MTPSRILIVDYDIGAAQALRRRLEHLGCEVTGLASTGADALEQAAAVRPNLALINIALRGEMSGPETAAQLQARQGLAVVYLLAYADVIILQEARITRPFGHLVKPFDDDELQTAVALALYQTDLEARLAASDVTAEKEAEAGREALLAAERGQRLKAETLAEVTLALAQPVTLTDALEEILRQANRLVPFDTANILLIQAGQMRALGWRGYTAPDAERFLAEINLPLDAFPAAAEAVARRQPVTISDTQSDPRWKPSPAMDWIRSNLILPLVAGDQVLGLLNVDSNQPGLFTADDAQRLAPLANVAALALQRAQLYESLRNELNERKRTAAENLRLVVELSGRVRGLTLLQATTRRLQDERAPASQVLEEVAASLPQAWQYPDITSARIAYGGAEARTAGFAPGPWMQESSFVTADGQRGSIQIVYASERPQAVEGPFLAEERALINSLAEMLRLHFDRRRAEGAERRYVARMEILHGIDRAILDAQSPEETAAAALSHVRQLIPCRRASVSLFDFDAQEVRLLAHQGDEDSPWVAGDTISLERYGRAAIDALRHGPLWLAYGEADSLVTPISASQRDQAGDRPVWLVIPLLYQGGLIGALNLRPNAVEAIDEGHLDIAREIADHISIAVKHSQLLETRQRRIQELSGLSEIAQTINQLTDVDETYDTLVAQTARLVGAESALIVTTDAAGLSQPRLPGFGLERESLAKWRWQRLNDDFRRAYTARGYLLAQTPEELASVALARGDQPPTAELRNMLVAPLRVEGQEIGHIILMNKPAGFTTDDARLLGLFASQAATVIRSARLFQAEHAARLQADTLLEVARAVSSTLSLPEVLQRLLQEAGRILPFISGAIMVFENDQPALLALTGYAGREEAIRQAIHTELKDSPILKRILVTRQPRYIADVAQDPDWIRYSETGYIRSWLGAPLCARDQVLGVLSLDSDQPGAFTSDHLSRAQALAAQAAVAVENAQLFAAERQARQQAEALHAAASALTQSLDLREVLEAMLENIERLAPFDTACVLLLLEDGGTLAVGAARGYERWGDTGYQLGRTFRLADLGGVQRAMRTRRGVLIADTWSEPEWRVGIGQSYVRNWIGVPLLSGGRVIGVYSLQKSQPNYFTETHLRLAETLSVQGVIAIQNARLFEQVRAGQQQLHALSQRLVTVQEEERRHLARELHDEIGQMLTGLKLLLGVIPRAPRESLNEKVGEALEVLNQLVEQVHALSLNLRPVILDDLGLTSALIWLFDRYTHQTGIQVHFESVGLEERLPSDVETTTYRIVQEALTNVARYAEVDEAWVRLRVEAGELRLQVQDRGQGFDAAGSLASRQRAGLAGMRERAALLGGRLLVDSTPGAGAHVSAVLPLARAPTPEDE